MKPLLSVKAGNLGESKKEKLIPAINRPKLYGICKSRTSMATNAETSNSSSKSPMLMSIRKGPVEGEKVLLLLLSQSRRLLSVPGAYEVYATLMSDRRRAGRSFPRPGFRTQLSKPHLT